MKRTALAVVTVVVAMLSAPAVALGDGPFDHAEGAGVRPFVPMLGGERHFAFSAHETTQGFSGVLDVNFPIFFGHVNADVTCLFVLGNRAIVGGVVRHSSNPELIAEGDGFAMGFEDNGPPQFGTPPDRASLNFTGGPPFMTEAECAAFAPLFFATLVPITSGNVEVYDAAG